MKRTYHKPTLKSVNLWAAEQLMTGSDGKSLGINTGIEADGSEALSNEEGVHDIWGREGNRIW